MTGETHIQMVASLKERGICNEAQKIWDVPGDCHTQTSVNEIVDELFNYLWALVDQPAWTEAPLSKDNNSGLLVTAADVEINGR